MHIALLGTGKTGSQVESLALRDGHSVSAFNRSNPPDAQRITECDCVISFLPGEAFASLLETLVDAGRPVISGSTGFEWPGGTKGFSARLESRGLRWVHAGNFSTGNAAITSLLNRLGVALSGSGFEATMHEIHHQHKVDAPSGTALAWKDALGLPVRISSERKGDVTGIHELVLTSQSEQITIRHEALHRSVFASGAIRAAELLLDLPETAPCGLLNLNDLMNQSYHLNN